WRNLMVDILHRVGIKAPINEVYKAVATREGVAAWWTQHTTGDSKVGGALHFRFTSNGEEIGDIEMKVLALQPNQQVRWQTIGGPAEWIGTQLSFDLRQDGEYVILLFKHQGWKEAVEFMHHCSTKWAIFLMSLKQLVETGQGLPNPHDTKIDDWN
ncbi:MAG TPA: SRPBCC domain-containing protein, partial [Rhizobacter sp.]|nr:SRPBCC domain-containing protein [Rhizobacter sp.]